MQFVPRAPELISLAGLKFPGIGQPTIVYPDPPLSSEEERLLKKLNPVSGLEVLPNGWQREHHDLS